MLNMIHFIMIVIQITAKRIHENSGSEVWNGNAHSRENKEYIGDLACNVSWAICFKTLEELM